MTALVLVETALSVDSIAPLLSPYGLRDFAQADDHIRALTITHPARSEFARFLPRILEAVSRSADPDAALRHFRHYANARSDKHSFYGMMKAMPPLLDDLMVTFGGSDYLAALLIRHPDYLAWWRETLARNPERVKEEMEADLRDWLRRFHTTDTRLGILRRFKRRESLRIGMRDLLKASSVEQTVKEMAYVADVCFQLAYEMGRAELDAKYGVPMEVDGDPARYAVIGMGKLGGTELNFSSDVDVLAVYSAEGKTTKGSANQAYFIRLTEFIIHAMTEPTSEGYVFRTDLRLRPQGASGGLARSLDSYIGYYETWGELFERQALIKARCVAGDEALGEEFLDAIQPFVYQTIVDQETVEDVLEEIHRTKLVKIEERIAKDGDPRLHVKLGPGGIRDVEFVVQALQLLHGGRLRDLRLRGTAETIEALERRGIFNPEDAARLTDSYHYMRRVENFVQLVADKQSYRLPEDPEDWERQARRLGYRDSDDQTAGDQFRDEYETHQRTIRAMFNKVFALEPDLFRDLINRILDEDEPTDETAQFLESYGLNDAKRAHQLLNEMSKGAGQVRYTPRVRRAFRKFVASLFEELRATPDPMLSLLQFVNFLSASKSRTQTYAMLQENRPTLQALIKTLGTSKFLGEILVREPLLFETLTYGSDINEKKTTVQAFLENLETGCDLSGDELLRHVQRVRLGELLRIGT
ncbi:MAG: hypothetical protein O3A46_14530, partial [Candidatus Poribacteria bacterium]|nr:hypothetical protein [Candidatus Poribacteria bacterium]